MCWLYTHFARIVSRTHCRSLGSCPNLPYSAKPCQHSLYTHKCLRSQKGSVFLRVVHVSPLVNFAAPGGPRRRVGSDCRVQVREYLKIVFWRSTCGVVKIPLRLVYSINSNQLHSILTLRGQLPSLMPPCSKDCLLRDVWRGDHTFCVLLLCDN